MAFGLWKRSPDSDLPPKVRCAHPLFVGRTDTELSIVGPLELESELGPSAEGFRLLTIRAEFGTTETGIFVTLALPLAEAGCWILPLGTHDTDHLLVREDQLERAVRALASAGHTVEG